MFRRSYTVFMQIVLIALCQAIVYGQADTTQKTVPEKTITTIHETTPVVSERKVIRQKPRLVGLFIKNRAGKVFGDKLGVFEDLVIGAVTDMGFEVVSPEDTVQAMQSFLGQKKDKTISGTELDALLENNTSALRLAQNMAVDYLFVASITTFGKDTQHIKRPDLGINRTRTTYKLRGTYKILDAGQGKALAADTILVVKVIGQSGTMSQSSDVVNDLLAEAALQFANKLQIKQTVSKLPASTAGKENQVSFAINCSIQDMSVPEVIKDKDGQYLLTGNRYKLKPLSVTVELDGVVVGTAPGEFKALPGLHKIKLTREGFEDWNRTINIRDKQVFEVALQLSDQGRQRWMQMANFMAGMKQTERLSQANEKVLKGYAQMLRQSGFRVDSKSDVKIDTKDAPTINQKNIDIVSPTIWGH